MMIAVVVAGVWRGFSVRHADRMERSPAIFDTHCTRWGSTRRFGAIRLVRVGDMFHREENDRFLIATRLAQYIVQAINKRSKKEVLFGLADIC